MEVLLSYTRKEGKQGQCTQGGILSIHEERENKDSICKEVFSVYMKRGGNDDSVNTEVYSAQKKREGKQGQRTQEGILNLYEERGKTRPYGGILSYMKREGKQGQYPDGSIFSQHEERGKQGQCPHRGILSPHEERGNTRPVYATQ